MRCAASVRISCADASAAATVLAALAPENGDWVRGRVEGRTLVLDAEAEGPAALRRTLEDALACASAALKGLGVAAPDDAEQP